MSTTTPESGTGPSRLLIVSYYFPPAGGGGIQRVLKLCKHLPAFGWDVEVLAPEDPKWVFRDPGVADEIPPGTVVHRAAYHGPSHERTAAERIRGVRGWRKLTTRAAVTASRLLVPDPTVTWAPNAVPAVTRLVRERGIEVVLTSSPPMSTHVIGSLAARRTGVRWVADFRDSWLANPHRRYERLAVRAKRDVLERVGRRTLAPASGVAAVTETIAEEARALARPGTPIEVISNGVDFDDFAGLEHAPTGRLRILHAGYFFGARSPRPFLEALARLFERRPEARGRVQARFVGGFRPADREWAEALRLDGALRVEGSLPHAAVLRELKAADALLLLIPSSGGLGRTVLSGKLFEYLAAERPILALVPPDGAAASLLAETGMAWVADPDDVEAIAGVLGRVFDEWSRDGLAARPLPPALRERLDRRARAAEMSSLLRRGGS